MFGNRMNYTQSPGGKRRGLIYQSSGERIDYAQNSRIRINDMYGHRSGMTEAWIAFQRNGDITFEIHQSNYSQVNFPVDSYTLFDRWYPIEVIPVYTFEIGNNSIDFGNLASYINNLDSDILIKRETINVNAWDGSTTTIDTVIVYYDITNVAIYQQGQSPRCYDIKNDRADRSYVLRGFKQKIPILSNTHIGYKGKMRYFTYPQDNIGQVPNPAGSGTYTIPINYGDLHEGNFESSGKLWYQQLSQTYNYRYIPQAKMESFRLRGNSPIKVDSYSYPYGVCFLLPPSHHNTEFYFYWYDIRAHQPMGNASSIYPNDGVRLHTTPSNLTYYGHVFNMPGQTLNYMAYDYSTSLYRRENFITQQGTVISNPVDDPNNLQSMWSMEFMTDYDPVELQSFDETALNP